MKTYLFQQTRFRLWIYVTAISIGYTRSVSHQTLSKGLHDQLFADYDTDMIPLCTTGNNVTVTIDVALRQVMDMDEPKQILTLNAWVRLKWKDCRLVWNPVLYSNLTTLNVLYEDVWIPDITLFDSAADMFSGREVYSPSISSDGIVTYNFPCALTSTCRINVRYFPFDRQRCTLKFGTWTHGGLNVDLVYRYQFGDVASFIESNEWVLVGFPAERNVLHYNCCPEPYPEITYFIILQRRPSFYVLTMVFPCILVTFVSILGFILPTEISLEITSLLSMAVFLLLISESLPPASENLPIIASYIAASMVLVSFNLLMTVLSLNVFHKGTYGRNPPGWIKTLFFKYIGWIVCVTLGGAGSKVCNIDDTQDTSRDVSSTETFVEDSPNSRSELNSPPTYETCHDSAPSKSEPTVELLQEQAHQLDYVVCLLKDTDREDNIHPEWRDIANILDRVFLIIYCMMTCGITIVFYFQNNGP